MRLINLGFNILGCGNVCRLVLTIILMISVGSFDAKGQQVFKWIMGSNTLAVFDMKALQWAGGMGNTPNQAVFNTAVDVSGGSLAEMFIVANANNTPNNETCSGSHLGFSSGWRLPTSREYAVMFIFNDSAVAGIYGSRISAPIGSGYQYFKNAGGLYGMVFGGTLADPNLGRMAAGATVPIWRCVRTVTKNDLGL